MVKEVIIGIVLVALATITGSIGALLFKLASTKINRNFLSLFFNFKLYLGALFYGFSSLIFVYALRYGELSVLYPVAALGYVWITLLSAFFLKEKVNKYKIIGIALVVFGVVLIGFGA